MKIGQRLKTYRVQQDLNLREVAEATKLDHATIHRIETGFIRNPKFCDVVKLCDFYKTDIRELK
jgi:transcriptional regulator with XRE-family HTH domain